MSERNTMLTKQDILSVRDFQIKDVNVPEWNGVVRMKTLSGKERDLFEAKISSQSQGPKVDIRGLRVFLLSLCIVDDANELMFTVKDLEALNKKSAKVINSLFEVAQEMNGIGEEAVKELLGNSKSDLNKSGGSDSQGN